MNERAFHQFTEFSVLLLVNDKKNKERQSADSGEVKRITENSSCGYIDDLITCVHVIQLKALTITCG